MTDEAKKTNRPEGTDALPDRTDGGSRPDGEDTSPGEAKPGGNVAKAGTAEVEPPAEEKEGGPEIPEVLPLLPVRDIVIFPYMTLPLFVGREGSVAAVDEALARDRIVEPPMKEGSLEVEALMRASRERIEKILSLKNMPVEILMVTENINNPGVLADLVASNLRLKIEEAQSVLEEGDPVARLTMVNNLLSRELQLAEMQAKIQNQAKEEMTKSQREYFLREQMKAIKTELGDIDGKSEEMEELREKVKAAGMPPEVEKEAEKQLRRLEGMHPDSAESSVVRTYLDWMVELPWKKETKDNIHIAKAKRILDEDHHDLEKVKERILEYLAVRKLKDKAKGPILCFVGPPGVGKTSLGKSIARAMGRKFVRMSLGGIRDEAEIRGHRRTYVGALPGRIIQGMKQAGTR